MRDFRCGPVSWLLVGTSRSLPNVSLPMTVSEIVTRRPETDSEDEPIRC